MVRACVPVCACACVQIGRNLKPAMALGMKTIRVDRSDSTGGHALRALAKLIGGQVGQRLQQGLRLAKL